MYLTVSMVAKQLHVRVITVYRWIESGKLPAFKIHKSCSYRVHSDDLDRFMESYHRYKPRTQKEHLVAIGGER